MEVRFIQIPSTAEEYLIRVKERSALLDCTFAFTAESGFADAVVRYLDDPGKLRKLSHVRAITEAFFAETGIPHPKMQFPVWSRSAAFMTDKGEFSLSLNLVYGEKKERVLKLLLHELSHFVLLYQPDYVSLLKLDLECRTGGKREFTNILTPVELYATMLSLGIFSALSEGMPESHRNLFSSLKSEEERKLTKAINNLSSYTED